MRRKWILGAPDKEMEAIEGLLKRHGQEFGYAMVAGRRVSPSEAYRADPVEPAEGLTLIECDTSPPTTGVLRCDHHRPGDPGYGAPPEQYWEASSLGQVCFILGIPPTTELRLVAAAAAAQGRVVLTQEREDDRGRALVAFIGDPGYSRGAEYGLPHPLPPGVTVVTSGAGAYGLAGRLGGWSEYLAVLAPGAVVTIRHKYGRRVLRVAEDGTPVLLTQEEYEAAQAAASKTLEPI